MKKKKYLVVNENTLQMIADPATNQYPYSHRGDAIEQAKKMAAHAKQGHLVMESVAGFGPVTPEVEEYEFEGSE